MADDPKYPSKAVSDALDAALGKVRRPKKLTTRAQHAIDAIADVLESDEIEASDRVTLEDARAALESYTTGATR